ncbi:MAG: hypothetical protein ACFCUJ_16160 [Thiotrichales bacterium]
MLPPAIIEIVASGFGPSSYPVEIGVVGATGAVYCTLVRPQPDWTQWDSPALASFGFSRTLLKKFGKSPREVALDLNSILSEDSVFSEDSALDQVWLDQLFNRAAVVQNFSVRALDTLLTQRQRTHWRRVKSRAGVSAAPQRHRASGEARLVQSTYIELTQACAPTEIMEFPTGLILPNS